MTQLNSIMQTILIEFPNCFVSQDESEKRRPAVILKGARTTPVNSQVTPGHTTQTRAFHLYA